ncbi:TPA_asm: hypothetical protein ES702_05923 [Lokiarchaeia virus SkuldV3]|uniref:Uncharacterized protein n=1 Tax=Lokiarchaeia virus SkuldV3 TaxID=2983915 RepID=A0A9N7AAP2_9VIRU|nr:hypothetical protein QKT74_gp20 [Lokiarchaeia virus SkuldV3]DAZ90960.1 TPA_asm: hypothetical protein ES702_05923 [Lokiarchaeia virus SkuldV3]
MSKKEFKIVMEIIILLLIVNFHFISEWFYRHELVCFFGINVGALIKDIVLYLTIGLIIILILLEKREKEN